MKRLRLLLVLAAAATTTGCASGYLHLAWGNQRKSVTVIDGTKVPIPLVPLPYYMGTMLDAGCVISPLLPDPEGIAPATRLLLLPIVPLCLADLPLSAALDTLLLPFDYLAHRRYRTEKAAHDERVAELRRRSRSAPSATPRPRSRTSGSQGGR